MVRAQRIRSTQTEISTAYRASKAFAIAEKASVTEQVARAIKAPF